MKIEIHPKYLVRLITYACVYLLSICAAISAEKISILFILADDLGSKGIAEHGSDFLETPHLDQLSRTGRSFELGIAPYPTCKPSRAAILSGQYGPRTGVYRVVDRHLDFTDCIKYQVPENGELPTNIVSLAQMLKDAGYTTAMYGKWHVSNEKKSHPTTYGFDKAVASTGHYEAKFEPARKLPDGMCAAELLTHEAGQFIEEASQTEKPFFLYMPYYLVHRPLEAKKEYIEYFKTKIGGRVSEEEVVVAAMTKMLDDYVGELLKKLDDLQLRNKTLIIFTSDNGSYKTVYNAPLRGVKGETYEGGLRVPYIFNLPEVITPKRDTKNRISGVDLYPTLMDLASVKSVGHTLDGVSLWPLLTGAESQLAERKLYCFYPKYSRYNKKTKVWKFAWRDVVYEGDFKLIYNREYDQYELFNLASDPLEKNNVADDNPEAMKSMKISLESWIEKVGAPEIKLNPDYSLKN